MSLYTREQLIEIILERQHEAHANGRIEYVAALRIQAGWRGFAVRKRNIVRKKAATLIQATWRGYIQRRRFFRLLEDRIQLCIEQFFDHHATQIERTWRGFRSRKQHFNSHHLHVWLHQLQAKRAELGAETEAYFADERSRTDDEQEQRAKRLCVMIARKLHHLLRTRAVPGVYSRKPLACEKRDKSKQEICEMKQTARTKIERLLASFGFSQFMKQHNAETLSGRANYLGRRNDAYTHTLEHAAALGNKTMARCDEHYRWRDMDRMEALWTQGRKRLQPRTKEQLRRCRQMEYQCELLTQGKYCDRIMKLSHEFEILHGVRDFCLNTHIVHRPERIEQFVEMLREYCLLHNLIEK